MIAKPGERTSTRLLLERNGNNVLQRQYIHGLRRIRQTQGSGASYYLYDGLSSVVNTTAPAGALQKTYSYEPFGQIRTESGTSPTNFWHFTGEYRDPTGLYHLRARQYDPASGRFLRLDPAESSKSSPYTSAYAYVANRPTVMVDPSGETIFKPSGDGQDRALFATSGVGTPSGSEAAECVGPFAVLAPICVRVGIQFLIWAARAAAGAGAGVTAAKIALGALNRVFKNPQVLENQSGSKLAPTFKKLADAANWSFGPLRTQRPGGYRVTSLAHPDQQIRFHPGHIRRDHPHFGGAPYWTIARATGEAVQKVQKIGKP